jgi:hypothetical protein
MLDPFVKPLAVAANSPASLSARCASPILGADRTPNHLDNEDPDIQTRRVD